MNDVVRILQVTHSCIFLFCASTSFYFSVSPHFSVHSLFSVTSNSFSLHCLKFNLQKLLILFPLNTLSETLKTPTQPSCQSQDAFHFLKLLFHLMLPFNFPPQSAIINFSKRKLPSSFEKAHENSHLSYSH
jgi:hypothetical protein